MHKQSDTKLGHNRCCWILGILILWWVLCIFHFSSSNPPQFAYGISSSMHSSSNQAFLSTLDSFPLNPLPATPSNLTKNPQNHPNYSLNDVLSLTSSSSDPCFGKLIYIHRLPKSFNEDLAANCSGFESWKYMCKVFSNDGLGPKLEVNDGSIISNHGWFATNQFALEVIFHNRMKQYKCLTDDSSKAALVYVPFYAGLDISRFLWGGKVSERDNLSLSLAGWLKRQDEWKVMGGRDHFMVCGHMTWDFRRLTDAEGDWGNKLLRLDVMQNMSTLLIDKSPWHDNDYAIPYPTYFHPQSYSEVLAWQERVRKQARPTLFSFAGAPRDSMKGSIRGELIQQCTRSRVCTLLECHKGGNKCHSPITLMKLFQESVFCLQPQGDSPTRRSIFDSMIAGCIPVFFHPHSAYIQYIWHFPNNHSEYSVYIPQDHIKAGNANIENILNSIPPHHVQRMREAVISLIPTLIYANPSSPPDFEDAFDVAIRALLRKVFQLRSQGALDVSAIHVK